MDGIRLARIGGAPVATARRDSRTCGAPTVDRQGADRVS